MFASWGDFSSVTAQFPDASSSLETVYGPSDLVGIFSGTTTPSLLFVTGDILSANSREILNLKDRCPHVSVVAAYTKANTQENIQWLKLVPVIDHLVPLKSQIMSDLLTRLSTTAGRQEFARDPLKLFLPAQLENEYSFSLRHVDDCKKCYEDLNNYVQGLSCFIGFSEIMITAASELLTNAFYNGKRDPTTGKAITPDRQVKFALADNEKITFRYGIRDGFFWMIVQDSFGSLDRITLFNAMNRAASERTANTTVPGGAGLGLIMLYEWSTEMGFSLSQGRSTMVACKFKITRRQREFDAEPSAVHVFGGF